jgi:hypothetical protein
VRSVCLAALVLAGCVGDAIVARAPATDAGAADALPSPAEPVLRIELTATGEDNASVRSDFAVTVDVFASRAGAPVDATLSLTRDGATLLLRAITTGHYRAGLDGYPSTLVLAVTSAGGARQDVPLPLVVPFMFQSPHLHQRVASGAALDVVWSPSGDASAVLLTPGGPRSVDDGGRLTLPPQTFTGAGERVIRLQRTTTVTPSPLSSASTLTVTVVNSTEIELE